MNSRRSAVPRSIGIAMCLLETILCSMVLYASEPALGRMFVIVRPVQNMYSSASLNTDVVSQAIFGTNVRQLEKRPGWLRIRTPDDYTGWVPSTSLRVLGIGEPPYGSQGRVAQVESLCANIYREADVTLHRPLWSVPFETRLEIVRANDSGIWFQAKLPDRSTGWIQRGDVTTTPKLLTIDESIALGRRFMEVTYVWGGVSSFGIDCSGLTQLLVRSRGIVMPRDADQQAAWNGVVQISKDQLQAGDLLYFGSALDHIAHTGMYIGNGQFIHCSTHGRPGVQIGALEEEPWKDLLVACRRIKCEGGNG